MNTVPVPRDLQEFSHIFTQNGFSVYLVGGAIRDIFLKKKPTDWDVATNASPQQVSKIFKRVIPTGIEHGTVTIPFRSHMIECTTFRTEQGYSDGRHPDKIHYAATIEEDLSRRDFTMNAIAVSLPDGKVIDPFNGRADIKKRIIKTVGSPTERFSEDGLRPLRAVRFSTLTDFTIEPETFAAIQPALTVTGRVAVERVRDELVKLIMSEQPLTGLDYLEKSGLMDLFLPELAQCRGIEQKGRHQFDVLDHLYRACAAAPQNEPEVRIAALFHDIGKPIVRSLDESGNFTFYHHETVSAKMTKKIMERLRFPNRSIEMVTHLIRMHMFHYEPVWTDAAVRRFIVSTGVEYIEPLFLLRRADSAAITGTSTLLPDLVEFRERINHILAQKHVFSLKDLAVTGNDLKKAGITHGPSIGIVLRELHNTVLDDPSLNTKERLIKIALAFCNERKIPLIIF